MQFSRGDRLGCQGYTRPTRPNIDSLASDAVRFDMAISTSAVTPVSHASILTGLNLCQHGLRVIYAGGGRQLASCMPTLATALQDEGWHIAAFPNSFTVSEFYGFGSGFYVYDNGLQVPVNESLRRGRDGV
jgi:arylsulfatase A-like enzyme